MPENLSRLLLSLNALTPDDIAIRELSVVDEDVHFNLPGALRRDAEAAASAE